MYLIVVVNVSDDDGRGKGDRPPCSVYGQPSDVLSFSTSVLSVITLTLFYSVCAPVYSSKQGKIWLLYHSKIIQRIFSAKHELLYHYRKSSVQKSRLSGRDRKFRSVGWGGIPPPPTDHFSATSLKILFADRQGLGSSSTRFAPLSCNKSAKFGGLSP